ncbi:GNAT family N-acetyltransferase [Paenibacillus sp. sptzw28]|uniref:GNAT family N-acetyltransferase n=1 Tax=Paenibacillus sp. sptzw28 TaxID=715179 RepID=UPI001C6DDD22|nr:GNAT family N-acetyltransferase [Paenibacillus sp. sptzw28]QYR21268.1 GNAT family N-acetyltransferase [Paenibacillus sp. sptzw28]
MAEWINGDYFISTDKALIDRHKVHSFLSTESYWAMNIPFKAVDLIIDNSFCFGIYSLDSRELVGFARVVTDFVRFAYLADVFIVPDFRGLGLSKWLVKTIVEYPDFGGVHFCLGTKDAHTLYEQYGGFKLLNENKTWMTINTDLEKIISRFTES